MQNPVRRFSMRKQQVILFYAPVFAMIAAPAAWAHTSSANATMSWYAMWNTDPLVLASLVIAVALYCLGMRRLATKSRHGLRARRLQSMSFALGIVLAAAALLSPIDALSAELFSVHMVQHELLMLAVAPLIVIGRPTPVFLWAVTPDARRLISRIFVGDTLRGIWRTLRRPSVAWALHAVILWAWHFPSLFQASLVYPAVHALQHASFLGSALLFWSSLMAGRAPLHAGAAVLYLLATAIHTGVLGALLTFSSMAWYPGYEASAPHWGLSALEDQQLGGLIMWIPAGLVFVAAGLAMAAATLGMAWPSRAETPTHARR
jgi:putative membrane protein